MPRSRPANEGRRRSPARRRPGPTRCPAPPPRCGLRPAPLPRSGPGSGCPHTQPLPRPGPKTPATAPDGKNARDAGSAASRGPQLGKRRGPGSGASGRLSRSLPTRGPGRPCGHDARAFLAALNEGRCDRTAVQVGRHSGGQRPVTRRVGEDAPQPPDDRMEGGPASAAVSPGLGVGLSVDGLGVDVCLTVKTRRRRDSPRRAELASLSWPGEGSAGESAHRRVHERLCRVAGQELGKRARRGGVQVHAGGIGQAVLEPQVELVLGLGEHR